MENTPLNYAGFWKRFAALIIDDLFIIFMAGSLQWTFVQIIDFYLVDESNFGTISEKFALKQHLAFKLWLFYLILFRWCYYAGMESSPLRATIGKLAVGIYVKDIDAERVTFAQATGRHFAKILSGLIFGIGYIATAFSNRKQAWHDAMSNCLVMSK